MTIEHAERVPPELATKRLDQAVSAMFPQYSRARLQDWIKSGELTVDGAVAKQKDKVMGGEEITIVAEEDTTEVLPEDIPLNIVFEDEHLLVLDKPAGLVVHPGAGNPGGTLMNGLLHYDPALGQVPRAGIVHRIDKDTTGLLVVAKTIEAQHALVMMLQDHDISREYDAITYGVPKRMRGTVDAPIARHPNQRTHMAIRQDGKEAVTHYEVEAQFGSAFAYIKCALETGRTHQIRVHMKSIGHPLVGDVTYGGGFRRPKGASDELVEVLRNFDRQALHARRLELVHPMTGEDLSFEADPPEDFLRLLDEVSLHE